MNEFRITKYNPQYRVHGRYCKNEWTSISDVGKEFEDGVVLLEDYIKVENSYIQCCLDLLKVAKISSLNVSDIELYSNGISLPTEVSDEQTLCEIIKCCLREKCWAKLETKHFYIHFGYDYYMYIGTDIPIMTVETISCDNHLFCELMHSPYGVH